MRRYLNMSGGCSLAEAGMILGSLFSGDTISLLMQAGVKPCGGTLKSPRYDRCLVEQLAAIRKSHDSHSKDHEKNREEPA